MRERVGEKHIVNVPDTDGHKNDENTGQAHISIMLLRSKNKKKTALAVL